MSSITRVFTLVLILSCMVIMLGCGDRNTNVPEFNYESSEAEHAEQWLPVKHSEEAKKDITACAECHGASYDGGISDVACTECHLGDETNIHPLDWGGNSIYARHAEYVQSFGTAECSNVYCHGAKLQGVAKSGPYCSTCHMGDTVVDGTIVFSFHPDAWDADYTLHGPYVLTNGTSKCSNVACHGKNLEGVSGSGDPCDFCHEYPF